MRTLQLFRPVSILLLSIFCSTSIIAQNGYLTHLFIPRYIKAGVDLPISVRARNLGTSAFTSFQVSWRVNNGTVHMMNQNVASPGVVGNTYMPITHPVQLNVPEGAHMLEVWITVAGDTDPTNDTLTVLFTALNNWAPKVVLLEARTETWCPVCPPANEVTNDLMMDPDNAVVKFHLSDGLEFPDGVDHYSLYDVTFTPAAVIDLGEYSTYTPNPEISLWQGEMENRATGVSPVHISLEPALNTISRELVVTVNATFTYAVQGPFKLNVFLAEDHVPGPQQSAPANYIHHGVMRAILGGASGTSGVIPNSPIVDETYTHTYTYTVPEEFKIQDLRLVGFVQHEPSTTTRYALNTVNSGASGVGIAERPATTENISIYPNPAYRMIQLHVPGMNGNVSMELFSIDGRSIDQRNIVVDETGSVVLYLGDLAPGTYSLRISDGRSVATGRLVRSE